MQGSKNPENEHVGFVAARMNILVRKRRENANENIILRRKRSMLYAGLDVHKKNIQAAVLDAKGKILLNERIVHTPDAVRGLGSRLPVRTRTGRSI